MDTKLSNELREDDGTLSLHGQGDTPSPVFGAQKRWPGIIVGIIALLLLAACLVGISSPIYYEAKNRSGSIYESQDFIDSLCQNNYALYWKMAQRVDGTLLSPVELFYPGAVQATEDGASDEYIDPETLQSVNVSLQNQLSVWYDIFQSSWEGYDYLAMDTETGLAFGNENETLQRFVEDGSDEALQKLMDMYSYYIVLQYDAEGHLTASSLHGASGSSLDALPEANYEAGWNLQNEDIPTELSGPRNAVFAYAVPANHVGDNSTFMNQFYNTVYNFEDVGYGFVFFVFLCIALLLGFIFAGARRFSTSYAALAIIPFEIGIVIFLIAISLWSTVARLVSMAFSGIMLRSVLPQNLSFWLSLSIVCLVCFIILAAVFCVGAALQGMRVLGAKEYFKQHSLIVSNAPLIRKGFAKFYSWFTHIDMTEKGNKAIVKFLIINFIVLALICLTWAFGIILLIIYSFILFLILRRYMRDLKRQYATLLDATTQMANGRLDIQINENVGVFEPVKNELVKIQSSFGNAVEAETKSQNMKTELITNVSHDLKTPLTAIITYVGLLKKEDITDEERRAYVDTLDTKSQRLKRLIEDLFEMSKASSRDITLNITQVDLPALIRQVEMESRDELGAADIEFRYQFPEDRIILPLDGDKTSRIFENLILNVAKYGMKGTRAYVSIQLAYGYAYVEMKNVSATELAFNGDITERFVRGDLSRTTEGSGLGLAIAKSFVEAQGGSFAIATDGDVFKALVVFPLPREGQMPQAAEQTPPEGPPPT